MTAGLAAALLRHAHEVECRRDRTVRADTHERLSADADRLHDRAEQVSR